MRTPASLLLAFALAACGSGDAPPAASSPLAERDRRVIELETEISELKERLEVMSARLQRVESGRSPAAVTSAPVQQPPQASRPAASQTSRPATPPPPAAPAASSTQPSSAREREPLRAADLAVAYREALALYGKGQYEFARSAFQRVYDADVNGELADNALYWIGETYFTSGQFVDALSYYQRIVEHYPDQNKAPDALFKLAASYARLGDLVLARKNYEAVISRYPYSTPAGMARGELSRIRY